MQPPPHRIEYTWVYISISLYINILYVQHEEEQILNTLKVCKCSVDYVATFQTVLTFASCAIYIYSQNYICKVSRCSESVCPHVVDIHMHICLCIWCGGMGLACLTLCLSLIESLSLSLPLVKATLVDFQTVQDLWSPPFACPYNIWHMYSIQIYI